MAISLRFLVVVCVIFIEIFFSRLVTTIIRCPGLTSLLIYFYCLLLLSILNLSWLGFSNVRFLFINLHLLILLSLCILLLSFQDLFLFDFFHQLVNRRSIEPLLALFCPSFFFILL